MFDSKGAMVPKNFDSVDSFRQILSDAGLAVYAATPNDHGDPYARLMWLVMGMVDLLRAENASLRSNAALDAEDAELFDIWRENFVRHPARLDKYLGNAETSEDVKEGLVKLRRDFHQRNK